MKKRVLYIRVLLLILAVVLFTSTLSVYADNGDTIVYRTRTGECYHNAGCSYLKSCIEITLRQANDMGLRPCSRCHPPVLLDVAAIISTPSPTPKVFPTFNRAAYSTPKPTATPELVTVVEYAEAPKRINYAAIATSGLSLVLAVVAIKMNGARDAAEVRERAAIDRANAEEQKRIEAERKAEAALRKAENAERGRIQAMKYAFFAKYGFEISLSNLAGVPLTCRTEDGVRLETVYITNHGHRYHRQGCSVCPHGVPVPLNLIYRRLEPCSKCAAPTVPDWYLRYIDIKKEAEDAGIVLDP